MHWLETLLYIIAVLAVIVAAALGIMAWGSGSVQSYERGYELAMAQSSLYWMLSLGVLLTAPLWAALGRALRLLDLISDRLRVNLR